MKMYRMPPVCGVLCDFLLSSSMTLLSDDIKNVRKWYGNSTSDVFHYFTNILQKLCKIDVKSYEHKFMLILHKTSEIKYLVNLLYFFMEWLLIT